MTEQTIHNDMFISYRRVDVDFVKEFVDAIKAKNKEVWIDWEDLPPGGEEFTNDIKRGIEGSDIFVCILSPDYMESTYCTDLELGYAVQLHKKIIPVVYRKFDDYPIPEGISHINWIYFTPHAGQDNTFDESFPRVIEAVEVDFDYVRNHTRLLQRAQEWVESNNTNSYLLNGVEITDSEAWLAQSATKRPIASVQHHEFIQASRRWESQKTRRNLAIAIFVTIFSIFLAGFAFVQRQEAIQQRAIAVEERNRATTQSHLSDSRRLAVQSRVALGAGDVDLSLLLGLEAIQSADTLEAIGSLVSAFENNPYLNTYLYDHPAPLISVAYHPTKPMMVTGADDGSLSIWDMETSTTSHMIFITDNEIWDIDYHPSGEQFAVALANGSIVIYASDDGTVLGQLEGAHEGIITSLNYSLDGEQLVTTSYDSNVIVWQTDSLLTDTPESNVLRVDDAETTHTDWILDADFSPDGEQLAVITWDSVLQIWDMESETLAFEPLQLSATTANFSVSVTWSPDGQFILIGDVLGNIRFAEASSATLVDLILSRHTDHVREITYSPDGTYFASVSHDGSIILWDARSGQLLTDAPIIVHSDHVNGVVFSPDGTQMITIGEDERSVQFDMTRPNLLGDHVLTQDSEIFDVIYMDTDDAIISAGLDGNVYITDTTTRESTTLLAPDIGRITAIALSTDETQIAVATDTGIIQLWDINTQEPLTQAFAGHIATIFSLAFSPDSQQLASAGEDTTILIWDVEALITGDDLASQELNGHDDGLFAVAWHPSEPILASASRDNSVRLWNIETLDMIISLEKHTNAVEALAFSPSGDMLASAGRDNSIIIWDVASVLGEGEPQSETIGGHSNWVLSLAFSPDGNTLVSGGRDRAILLWDMSSLQVLGEALIHHTSWVWSVDVSPDGLSVVSGGRDNRMVVWDIALDHWKLLACQIANRSLTPEEWAQYRSETEYRRSCPQGNSIQN